MHPARVSGFFPKLDTGTVQTKFGGDWFADEIEPKAIQPKPSTFHEMDRPT